MLRLISYPQHKMLYLACLLFVISCAKEKTNPKETNTQTTKAEVEKKIPPSKKNTLNIEQANRLAALPLKCMQHEFPNKLNQTLGNKADIQTPRELHPAFYGCFDWHSAVHGHWMLIELLRRFPYLENGDEIRKKLQENISRENILAEVKYFEGKHNKSWERTYGWAWLLKLSESLYLWDDPMAKTLHQHLEPLTQLIRDRYLSFLPKLYYPIRVGEHTNTGFGISFAWDYANTVGDTTLLNLINQRAKDWFLSDKNCPLEWEPSGYDFLSPCLEEADIMSRVLSEEAFNNWLKDFLPQLFDAGYQLKPGQVTDRSDGKLVHLDGLNFSRAWVLYRLAKKGFGNKQLLERLANEHLDFSIANIVDGDYAGEHWLASFALYALIVAE